MLLGDVKGVEGEVEEGDRGFRFGTVEDAVMCLFWFWYCCWSVSGKEQSCGVLRQLLSMRHLLWSRPVELGSEVRARLLFV